MKTLQIKTFLTCWLLSSLLFLTGCSVWEEDTPAPEDSRQITLVYQQLTTTDVTTRGIQTTDEVRIGDLYAIFYKSDNSLAGVSVTAINTESEAGTVSLNLPDGVSASEAYKIHFLANPEDYVNKGAYADVKAWLKTALSGSTYDTATGILEGITKTPIENGITASATSKLPMFGKTTKDANVTTIGASLTRLVSRVDLYVNTEKLAHSTFELKSAEIWNARKHTKLLTGSSVGLDSDDFVHYNKNVATPSFDDVNGIDQIEAKLYAFPNYQTVTEKGDGVTTCLIIEGIYNEGEKPSYYRLNIKPKIGSQVLKPNHRYKITITGVLGAGAKTKDDAYKESDSKLIYEIDEWKPGDMGNGITDIHGNKLNASPAQVVFSYLAGQDATIKILKTEGTTPPTPNEVTVTSSDLDNFSATLSSDGSSFDIKVLTDNYGNEDREAYIIVKWGTMEVPVYISQLGATSTAGGLRVAPNALHFGKTESTQDATLLVSGDLSGISASQISYKVLKTENDLETGYDWCTIDGGFTESSTGLYTFTVKAIDMKTNASYVRSAIIYFTLTKTNGEILNATMSVKQSPSGGESGTSSIAVHFLEWDDNISTDYPAANVEIGYTNHNIWGDNTANFMGFPDDKIGPRHLHFSLVESKAIKFRLVMPTAKSWRIVVKDDAVGRIQFTATTSEAAKDLPNGWVHLTAVADNNIDSPWSGGSFVVEYSDGSEDVFFVHQYGVVSRLKNSSTTDGNNYNGRLFYYGLMKINGRIWLDRNLGASSDGVFTNKSGWGGTDDANAKGVYFVYANRESCPAGFRLPKGDTGDPNNEEWGYVFKNIKWVGAMPYPYGADDDYWVNDGKPVDLLDQNGKSVPAYKNGWFLPIDSSDPVRSWILPLSGNGDFSSSSLGNYWHASGYVGFSTNGAKSWSTAQSYTRSVRCVRE